MLLKCYKTALVVKSITVADFRMIQSGQCVFATVSSDKLIDFIQPKITIGLGQS